MLVSKTEASTVLAVVSQPEILPATEIADSFMEIKQCVPSFAASFLS
jgi:hypothetical protein